MKAMRNAIGNNKGFSIVIAMTMVMVTAALIIPMMRQITTERRISERLSDLSTSFYSAESALNIGLRDLERYTSSQKWIDGGWNIDDPDYYTLGTEANPVRLHTADNAFYIIGIRNPMTTGPYVEATGYSGDSERSILMGYAEDTSFVDLVIDNVIKTKGTISVGGNATVSGTVEQNADFDFEDIFGKTLEEMKQDAFTEVVTDPANNHEPVPRSAETFTDSNDNGVYDYGEPFADSNSSGDWDDEKTVTWFDMESGGEARITRTGWRGKNILIVEGNFRMTGGRFDGIIYVKGQLDMAAGNPVINGAIFIDGDSSDEARIRGTAEINYDETAIGEGAGRRFEKQGNSWREYYPQ